MGKLKSSITKERMVYTPKANEMFTVYDQLTDAQAKAGKVANVLIEHPAFTANVSVFKSQRGVGNLYVSEPSVVETTDDGKEIRRAYLQLNDEVKNYIVELVKNKEEQELDYLSDEEPIIYKRVTTPENESIGIIDLVLDDSFLSKKQGEVGIIAKCQVETTVGVLRNISVFEMQSKKGIRTPLVPLGKNGEDTFSFYTLTSYAKKHIQHITHINTDWEETREWRPRTNVQAIVEEALNSEVEIVPDDFTPVAELDESAVFGG